MSNLAQWSALVGFLSPIVIAIVQQSHWPRWVRTVIGIISCLLTAGVTAAVEGKLTWDTWATSSIVILTTAFVAYRSIWIPLGAAPWVEQKTNVTTGP